MSYSNINWTSFLIGLVIVIVPIPFLYNVQGGRKWVYPYVGLILLSMLITNYNGVDKFNEYVKSLRS